MNVCEDLSKHIVVYLPCFLKFCIWKQKKGMFQFSYHIIKLGILYYKVSISKTVKTVEQIPILTIDKEWWFSLHYPVPL